MNLKTFNFTILVFFFSASLLWPYYIDIRLLENIGLNPQRISIVFLFAFTAIYFLFSSRAFIFNATKVISEFGGFYLFLCVFLIFRFISAFISEEVYYSVLITVNDFVLMFLIGFLTLLYADSEKKINLLFHVLYFCAAISSMFVIAEFVFEKNIFVQFADPMTKAGEVALYDKTRDGIYRAQGFFEHPITQAQVLLVVCIFSYFVINRKLYWILLPIISIAIIFTGSRFGQLSLFAFLVVLFHEKFLKNTQRIILIVIHYISVLMMVLLAYGYVMSASDAEVSSSITRVAQLLAGVNAIEDSPIFGHGPGLAARTLFEFSSTSSDYILHKPSVDNYFLSIAVESGVFSLVSFLVMLYWVAVKLKNEMKRYDRKTIAYFLTYISFSSFLVLSIFHAVYFVILIPLLVLAKLRVELFRNVRIDYRT